jgi:cytochrome P450
MLSRQNYGTKFREGATLTTTVAAYWDPYDVDIARDPYPSYRRLRAEAPLYYNEKHDFYAVSRFADCENGLKDWETFRSGRGAILELIRAGIEIPPGTLIFEDPPIHDIHRSLLVRVFTPRRVAALEPKIREICTRALDAMEGADRFDLVAALGAQTPMRVISMLLGIPESDQEAVRDRVDANLRTEPGQPMRYKDEAKFLSGEMFGDYIDWRAENPSDDLMTDLLTTEFEDENGVRRTLTRKEARTYVEVVAGAGNETTNRLIGWMGDVLARFPDQRAELAADPALIPAAVEEILRFEPPAHHVDRYVARDTEIHGQTVPEGSVMIFLLGSANRDEDRHPAGETFDIHRREVSQLLTFGLGGHYCMGAALARLEGRIALEELLKRFPRWEVDYDNAKLLSTSVVRGWETLPVVVS